MRLAETFRLLRCPPSIHRKQHEDQTRNRRAQHRTEPHKRRSDDRSEDRLRASRRRSQERTAGVAHGSQPRLYGGISVSGNDPGSREHDLTDSTHREEMSMTTRCTDGRLMRHDPQRDDPYLETDIGECPECEGEGCGECGCCGGGGPLMRRWGTGRWTVASRKCRAAE